MFGVSTPFQKHFFLPMLLLLVVIVAKKDFDQPRADNRKHYLNYHTMRMNLKPLLSE